MTVHSHAPHAPSVCLWLRLPSTVAKAAVPVPRRGYSEAQRPTGAIWTAKSLELADHGIRGAKRSSGFDPRPICPLPCRWRGPRTSSHHCSSRLVWRHRPDPVSLLRLLQVVLRLSHASSCFRLLLSSLAFVSCFRLSLSSLAFVGRGNCIGGRRDTNPIATARAVG